MLFLRQGCGYSMRTSFVRISVFSVLFLFENGYCTLKDSKGCPREITLTSDNASIVAWNSRGIADEIVISEPPCVDEKGNLITRICHDKNWIPTAAETKCLTTTHRKRCPDNYEETSKQCILLAPEQTWGNICTAEALERTANSTTSPVEILWLPYKRIVKYGSFVSLTFGENYGKPFNKKISANLTDPDFFKKDCLVVNVTSDEYFPEYCDRKHQYICEFSKKEANNKCPKNCVYADLLTGSCYCKQKYRCSIPASVNTIFDYTVLVDLADIDQCYVNNDFSNHLEYQHTPGIGVKYWSYTNKSLDCYLCLFKSKTMMKSVEPQMILNFDEKTQELYLTIYSPQGLYEEGNEKTIYCYTDAAPYELKTKVKVEKILENNQSSKYYNVYEVDLEYSIGIYYCEAYRDIDNEDDKVYSNHVLAYKYKTGAEFSVRIVIKSICVLFPCHDQYMLNYEDIFDHAFGDFKNEIRVMEIYMFDFKSLDLLLHVSTKPEDDIMDSYEYIRNLLQKKEDLGELDLIYIRSSQYCLPEAFDNLTWPLTVIGQAAVSEEMCLQSNTLPVTRICGGRFLTGGEWKSIVGECSQDVELPDSTKYIFAVLNQSLNDETVNNISDVIKHEPNLPVISIYYASKLLDKIYLELNSTTPYDSINSTLNLTDSLLTVNKEHLAYSQEILNVTDALIDVVDNIFVDMPFNGSHLLMQRQNIIMHVTNPNLSNISGLVVYHEDSNELTVTNLPRNSSFDDIGPNAIVALIIPEELINHKNSTNISVITTIYFKDAFFNSSGMKKPADLVISVSIPEFVGYLPVDVPVLFKVANYVNTPECGFWDYGKSTVRKKGHWSTVGGTYVGKRDNTSLYHICSYSHLTHFSILRTTLKGELSYIDDTILDIIMIIADVLSLLGVSGIFLTAVMFKRWRKKQGTIILLNLSVSILFEITLMQVTDLNIFFKPAGCSVFGILIHYIVICKFCWMLVYSFLQYMRFVKVLSILPENIVLKCTIFGWGFAIIPVVIVNIVNGATYTNKRYNYCYPEGLFLYLGVLLPAGIIILINTVVFIIVMKEVTSKTVESHGTKENIQKLQIQLGFLLFFVLGVPWLFFIFANLIHVQWLKLTLVYLFCITANVQGFILFLFYVVFNTETRQAWLKYFIKKRPKSLSISTRTTSNSRM